MEMEYCKWYSPALAREMEVKFYGHAGKPVLYIPCQNGRFYDFENFGMAGALTRYLESGRMMVCAVDTIDAETWSDRGRSPQERIGIYEQWITYLTDEVIPALRDRANERNGWTGYPGVLAFGCSLGATHAANLYFRRPDLFDSLLALSGIYTAEYGFDGYMDERVYLNSPVHSLANMPSDHPYISLFNQKKAIICVGTGAWELPEETRRLETILREKNIRAVVDYWGPDCSHDWYWWHAQADYFLPQIL